MIELIVVLYCRLL
uniref:Uncharacterized protein n=1 Tax=Rhizophora mucronata TaxID=61149 RepID=A0A2P2QIT2_RHIMU